METRRAGRALAAAGALAAALVLAGLRQGCAPTGPAAPEEAVDAALLLSLLAVGDTGDRHALPALREGQLSVARGLREEDLRRPVDALVLLGDNFYPDGLPGDEVALRVRENVVRPYCRFVALAGPRSAEVADACGLAPQQRRPVPLFAVLGNHDYGLPESAELQRRALPDFVSNWRMPEGVAEVVELGAGVSLILFDSMRVRGDEGGDAEGAAAELRAAIARARGPWRILAGHHPTARLGSRRPAIGDRLAGDGPRVQLSLAGHLHQLGVIEGEPPGPALHVIAGSGSTIHELSRDLPRQRFAAGRTGFARVDLVRDRTGERLVASLYAMPRYPAQFWPPPELVARWSVDLAGRVRREHPPPER